MKSLVQLFLAGAYCVRCCGAAADTVMIPDVGCFMEERGTNANPASSTSGKVSKIVSEFGTLNVYPDSQQIDRSIRACIQEHVPVFTNFWRLPTEVQFVSEVTNALSDPKANMIQLGIPLLRLAYTTSEDLLPRYGGRIGVAAILAHEFAHQMQWRLINDPRYRDDAGSKGDAKWIELEADALSGAWLKGRYGKAADEYWVAEIFGNLGDNGFHSYKHHGTGWERANYTRAGMNYYDSRRPGAIPYNSLHTEMYRTDLSPRWATASAIDVDLRSVLLAAKTLESPVSSATIASNERIFDRILAQNPDLSNNQSLIAAAVSSEFGWDAEFEKTYRALVRARALSFATEQFASPKSNETRLRLMEAKKHISEAKGLLSRQAASE